MTSEQNDESVNSIILCDICGKENSDFTIKIKPTGLKPLYFYICQLCTPHKKYMSFTVDRLWNFTSIN